MAGDALYLSVVIPVRDEAGSLRALHRELDAALGGVSGGIEILLVDDGSRDDSLARMREIAGADPRLALALTEGQDPDDPFYGVPESERVRFFDALGERLGTHRMTLPSEEEEE